MSIQALHFYDSLNGPVFGLFFDNGYTQYILPTLEGYFGFCGVKTLLFPPEYYLSNNLPPTGNPDYTLTKPHPTQPKLF